MKICFTCQQPFVPTAKQLLKRAELLGRSSKLGEYWPRCCELCQAENALKALQQLAVEWAEEQIEQGESIGEGEL